MSFRTSQRYQPPVVEHVLPIVINCAFLNTSPAYRVTGVIPFPIVCRDGNGNGSAVEDEAAVVALDVTLGT